MTNPKVSVIIPTYNRTNLLPRAIKSVLNQTFKDFELIIVDDCSTDNTEEVIRKFQKKDKRIKHIRHEKNRGLSAVRNTGIRITKGEYIGFLDDDDEWLPEKLEKQIKLFSSSPDKKLGFVACDYLEINSNTGAVFRYNIPKYKNAFKTLLKSTSLCNSSNTIVKRNVLDDVGFFDENLEVGEDRDMWIRIAQKYDFDFVPELLFRYYIHQNNITKTTSNLRKTKDEERIIEKYKDIYTKFPKLYSNELRWVVRAFILGYNLIKGRSYLKQSIKYNKLNIRSYLYYFCRYLDVGSII